MPNSDTTGLSSLPLAVAVDDEPGIRNIVAALAREAGFVALTAESGATLRNLLADMAPGVEPAVILLDLQMPGTDGVQIMSELAARGLGTRIVLLSGTDIRVLELAREVAEQRGLVIAGVVQKPFRRTELLDILGRIAAESEIFSAKTLRACFDRGSVALHYQPKIALATRAVAGVEALLRCKDQAGRPVSPEVVVAAAEQDGMIDALTEWVFREAIRQRRVWSDEGRNLSVAVNLSARCSFNAELPDLLAGICAEHGVPIDAIIIELTEAAVMNDRLLASEALLRLRLKGFRLAIDDFGVGYSSLVRLKQLPFTEVKVDKSFVTALHKSRDNPAIVRAIVQLSQALDMETVIEGVEDAEALEFVASLGSTCAQGYHIARPMPAADFAEFMLTWKWRRASMPRPGGADVDGTDAGAAVAEAGTG